MQFTLPFLLLAMLMITLCLAAFDCAGLVIGVVLAASAVYAARTRTRTWATSGVVMTLGVSLFLLLPAIRYVARAWEEARRTVATTVHIKSGFVRQAALGLRNYCDRFGSLPPVQVRDSQGLALHSWRVLVMQSHHGQEYDQFLASRYNRGQPWNGADNRKLAIEHPCEADYLAVVNEQGDWLRPIAGSNPAQVIESRGTRISWYEPRDITVDEACRAIHVARPFGSLAHRLVAEEGQCVLASLADGNELWIPVDAPPAIVRDALLGDRTKQLDLESYRNAARRLYWFDYLNLAAIMACWIATVRTPRSADHSAMRNAYSPDPSS